ncbi:MAG: type I restriction enzyme endonuclease domain-containing protein, partial [Candidatus Paceibacterota bacterium]
GKKFESARNKYPGFIDADQNIFVLIDEAHRSQGGIANFEMTKTIPNACYIGFTGTPLMASEKESWRKFGGYIDKYTIDDALLDNIIVPLIYEGRYAVMTQNAGQIDRQVDRVSEGLNPKQKKELQKYISTRIIKDNPQRITEIAYDIEKHFTAHFQDTGLKAQIVAPSKYSAVLFQEFFEKQGKIRTAMVISDEHEDGDVDNTHKKEVVACLDRIREKHSSVASYEKNVIESFKYNDDGVEMIIVVDKLLTGFDAPRNTVLYLAKDLKDHNLLQAIARVNRLYENKKLPKTAGYIIDYSENAKNIDTAMRLFGSYDEKDVKGTLIDVGEKIKELEQGYGLLHDLFNEISGSADDEEYLQFLKDDPRRETFYKVLNDFIRKLNECFVLQDFVHEFRHLDVYKRDLKKFMELRKAASLRYADRVDLAEYKQALVTILDRYVDANGVELLTKQINITDRKQFEEAVENLGSDRSKAEAIAAQVEKTVKEKMETDPEFYDRFSKKIKEVLDKMHQGKLADIASLKQLKLLRDDILNKKDADLPEKIKIIAGADVFYRNLKDVLSRYSLAEDEYIVIVLDILEILKKESIVDWYKNIDVKRRMMNALDDYLYDIAKNEKGINLTNEEIRVLISDIMQLAVNNYGLFA